MADPTAQTPNQSNSDDETVREAERNEREERRGLEARGGTLFAAGAATVGLVATALGNIDIKGAERDRVLVLIAVASGFMLVSLLMVAWSLWLGMTAQKGGEPLAVYVERIKTNNQRMVRWLRLATATFAVAVAAFLATLIWTAYASAPPSKSQVVIVRGLPRPPRGPGRMLPMHRHRRGRPGWWR